MNFVPVSTPQNESPHNTRLTLNEENRDEEELNDSEENTDASIFFCIYF